MEKHQPAYAAREAHDEGEDEYVAQGDEEATPTAIKSERRRKGTRQFLVEWNYGEYETWEDSSWVEEDPDVGPLLHHFRDSLKAEKKPLPAALEHQKKHTKEISSKAALPSPSTVTTAPAQSLPDNSFGFALASEAHSPILKITVNYTAEQLLVDLQMKENAPLMQMLTRGQSESKLSLKIASGGNCSFSFHCCYDSSLSHFLKVNFNSFASEMFANEAFALEYISKLCASEATQQKYFRVPRVLKTGTFQSSSVGPGAFLLLEYIALELPITAAHQKKLGRKLAQFHLAHTAREFGFERDNYLGLNRVANSRSDSWIAFMRTRLLEQMRRMHSRYYEIWLLLRKIVDLLPQIFANAILSPHLLHGDIGPVHNWGVDKNGNIVIFDVCPFYGHMEMDLTRVQDCGEIMGEYRQLIPKQEGFEMRMVFYELYTSTGLMNMRTASRYRKDTMHLALRLLEMLQPGKIEKIWPAGADIPMNKLRAPRSPRDANTNVILLFSGTFSPVHLNHLSVVDTAVRVLETRLKKDVLGVYFIPALDEYVTKKLGSQGFSRDHRCAMLLLALEQTRWMLCSAVTEKKMHIHYVIKDALTKFGWNFTLMYMCGTDGTKPSLKRLAPDVPLVIVRRNRYDEDFRRLQSEFGGDSGNRIIFIPEWTGPDISSTRIRGCLASGEESVGLRSMLHPNVLTYIREHHLADVVRQY